MPSLRGRAVKLPEDRYERKPAGMPGAAAPAQALPTLPEHLLRDPRMISSLPSIAASLDGATRQFFGNNLPKRRISLP